jgi:hypothetical protein
MCEDVVRDSSLTSRNRGRHSTPLQTINRIRYNQEKGIQFSEKKHIARRIQPPTGPAAQLKNLIQHRIELVRESTRKKNKLTAICDEVFPEFTKVYKDPNRGAALLIREHFPTPHSIVTAKRQAILKLRKKQSSYPSPAQIALLKDLAAQTIGAKDAHRLQGLVFEQTLLIRELRMVGESLKGIEEEIHRILHASREGKILLSVHPIGNIMAATILAEIGNIANFETAGRYGDA